MVMRNYVLLIETYPYIQELLYEQIEPSKQKNNWPIINKNIKWIQQKT